MKQKLSFNPLLCAVLGAVPGYYGFGPLMKVSPVVLALAALAVLAAVVSVPRVLSSIAPDSYGRSRLAFFSVFFAAGFALGLASFCAALRAEAVGLGQERGKVTGISGTLLDDPRLSASGRGMAYLKLKECSGKGGVRSSARGQVLVFFPEGAMPRLKDFGRGSEIFVDGAFPEPGQNPRLMFRAGSVHVIKAPPPLDRLRTKVRLALVDFFSAYDWGALALALLVGIKDGLDSELAVQYRDSGCSYILALSGMHLAIVSSIIAFLLRKPLGLRAAAAVGAVFIAVYMYLVGAQSSLLRAGISYFIGAAAIMFAFKSGAVQVLGLSFIIQIVLDPASGGSVSFILSYLALAGILVVGEPLGAVAKGVLPQHLAQPLSASIGAFVATMAVTAAFFGDLRPVGIAAGLAIAPLTTVFMIGAIAFPAARFLVPPLARPLDFALSTLYALMDGITGYASKAPPLPIGNMPVFVIVSSVLPLVIIYLCAVRLKVRYSVGKFD